MQVDWSQGLLHMHPPSPVPCSSQGDSGRGAVHSYTSMVASKVVVSLDLQLLVNLPVLLPEVDGVLLGSDRVPHIDLH